MLFTQGGLHAALHASSRIHFRSVGENGKAAAGSRGDDAANVRRARWKLVTYWYTFGEYDVMLITQLPDNATAAGASIAATASGMIKALKTTPLMSSQEAMDAMRKAGKAGYQPPK
jgi:uncharacterized protein with GYD domain